MKWAFEGLSRGVTCLLAEKRVCRARGEGAAGDPSGAVLMALEVMALWGEAGVEGEVAGSGQILDASGRQSRRGWRMGGT